MYLLSIDICRQHQGCGQRLVESRGTRFNRLLLLLALSALRIHISSLTYIALDDIGSYEMTPRGEMNIKV